MDSRKVFFEALTEMARKDKDIILLVGDLGYSFMEDFAKKYPKQFVNAGIAEQNMVGMAAGMAREGKKVFVYSGAMFLVCRAYEQLRDDIAYPNLPVKLIGTGAAGFLGFTHNFEGDESSENFIRPLPNIKYHQYTEPKLLTHWMETDSPVFVQL